MQTTISNEFLTVTIDTHGAEVVSVKNSKGEELIWQADPAIWDRHSPVLFPWAGRLANGELVHNGKHYSGGQHGFIRDLEHILKQNNGISAQLMFRADEETKTLRFPFDFEFTSVFTLDGHTLHHEVHVKNCGDENMRCGIGFHPGFNIPFDENHTTTDYEIRFEQEESPIILDCLPHGLLSGKSFYQFVIKNIVFDMGNVLVRFDPELFMDRYSLTGEDRKLIRNEVFRSVEWTMLDRGVIDEEIAEQRILPRLPERLHDAARGLIEKWDDPIVPVEGMLELLQALKAKGYRLYLLSNAATRQPIYWARAEASKLMDGALISAEVKLLKPDPQIYRTFLRKFALRPEECVFIDDTPINVEGALYENMAGIVFNMDVAALAESLHALGVEW